MSPQLTELLAGAINHIDQRQVDLMLQLNDLKTVVATLHDSVHTEIAKRPDLKAIQADVDAITAQLKGLHIALTQDASVAGLAAVAQALNTPVTPVAPVAAPTPVESAVAAQAAVPAAPAAPSAAPSAVNHGPATGKIPEWLTAVVHKIDGAAK